MHGGPLPSGRRCSTASSKTASNDWRRRRAVQRRLFFRRDDDGCDDGSGGDWLERVADPAQPHGPALLQSREAMQRLARVLRALPRRQREAFELRIWEGLDVADTAKAMTCSSGSVKTYLSRALQVLRRELQGIWP